MLRIIRNILSDKSDDFTFRAFNNSLNISPDKQSGLYIHIPFCKNSCPYCPYFKVAYDSELAEEFKNALIKEIEQYHTIFGKRTFTSLYFGGGTPTLMINEMPEILRTIGKFFEIKGDIAVETSPSDITEDIPEKLKAVGVNLISIGVQSFCDKHLVSIGRKYNKKAAEDSLSQLVQSDFKTINVDLIFAYPDQTLGELKHDLSTAISHNVDQITCYPLFTFPYTEIGKMKRMKKMKMPKHFKRKKFYYFINEYLSENGYSRTNVWSFSKNISSEFSSVTRNYYLGLGASSGSYNGDTFYFNTFSLDQYINTLSIKLPISLAMNVSKKLQKNLWLYWQLYTTIINKQEYFDMFNSDIRKDFGFILKLFKFMNFIEKETDELILLNTGGSHWIHLIQNYYALNYVNKIWTPSKQEAWPKEIKL